jgi:hypothetical protein
MKGSSMPNWVYNSITVTAPSGDKMELEMFLREMEMPRPEAVSEGFEPTGEIKLVARGFSFWNVIAPPADKLEEYFGIHGWKDGKEVGNTDTNWYNWNNENWGCKWDAGDGDVGWLDEDTLQITFQTPWDCPRGVVAAIAEQYSHLVFSWVYEEEQGWGGELTLKDGEVIVDEEWDIPDSHADYTKRGNECRCEWGDDKENWFEDCPTESELVTQ